MGDRPVVINLRVRWRTDSKRSAVTLARGRVLTAMKTALVEAQIDMPYATQVVLFRNQTEEAATTAPSSARFGRPAMARPASRRSGR